MERERRFRETWITLRRISKNPLGVIGFVIVAFFLVLYVIAPLLVPPNSPDPLLIPQSGFTSVPLPPSPQHIFGTTGPTTYSDVYYGVVWGTRTSFLIAASIMILALAIGIPLGAIAGYFGGGIDEVISRITDVFFAVPNLVLAIVLISALGKGIPSVILSIGIVYWPNYVRLVRGEILRTKQELYVANARVIGVNPLKILARHILPNSISPVLVLASMDMGRVVLLAAGLGFLGIGVNPGTAEWGVMISQARDWLLYGAWWITVFPGLAIFAFVLGWNLLGDAFRDILDPRTRREVL